MHRYRFIFIILAFTGAWVTAASPTQASCGSANCFLVTGTQEKVNVPGQLTIDLSYRYIPMDVFHRGAGKTDEILTPGIDFDNGVILPDHHREFRTINELFQLDASYGVTERLTLQLTLPVINDRLHQHDIEVGTPAEEFSRDDTSGFGDIRLLAKYALVVSTRHLLVIGGGVKTPSGEYKLLNSEGEINEATLMPGTGSWDGLFSLFYDYQILPHRLDAFVSGSYQLTTENELNYEFADQVLLSAGINYLLTQLEGGRAVSASLQVNSRLTVFPTHDQYRGMNVPSTGGAWVYLTPGVRVQANNNLGFYTFFQLPLYQYVNEVNLVPRYGLVVGATYGF